MSTLSALASDGLMNIGTNHLYQPANSIFCYMTTGDSPTMAKIFFLKSDVPPITGRLSEVQALMGDTVSVSVYSGSGSKCGELHFPDPATNFVIWGSWFESIVYYFPLENSPLSVVYFNQSSVQGLYFKTQDIIDTFTAAGLTVP